MNTQTQYTQAQVDTMAASAARSPEAAKGFLGETSSVNYTSVIGAIGGVIGGVMHYAEGGSAVTSAVAGAAGAFIGYTAGGIVNPINSTNLSFTAVTGVLSCGIGLGVAGMVAGMGSSLEKLSANKGE